MYSEEEGTLFNGIRSPQSLMGSAPSSRPLGLLSCPRTSLSLLPPAPIRNFEMIALVSGMERLGGQRSVKLSGAFSRRSPRWAFPGTQGRMSALSSDARVSAG